MINMEELVRAVVEAARTWRVADKMRPQELKPSRAALAEAVDKLEAALQPRPNEPTGAVLQRVWAEVPAGWFAKAPNGAWYEVMATEHRAGKQYVTLRVDAAPGGSHTWPRLPSAVVDCRRGTAGPSDRDVALDALRAAFSTITILEDRPPW